MLWEIGTEGCEVRALRSRLALDSGHTSRVLRGLQCEGLIDVRPSPADRRIRVATLTRRGIDERRLIDRRANDAAVSILSALDDRHRADLVDAMRTVERLLTSSMIEIRRVDPAGADAQRCLRAYFAELERRSGISYDPTKGVSAEPHELRPPAGEFLVAFLRREPVGCGGVKHHSNSSHIKRMWVAESVRGVGVGRRILELLEAAARERGTRATRIDTNRSLTEAIALYRSAGYTEVPAFNDEPFAHHWFEKSLSAPARR